ncbi:S-methyl-5'-thioinosine phosphorylase [Teredinibacter purpureus]|uniref:S-methyl-5'-thioinosine phosphorylase n=1 Tax=Teredinibacter purpureus TaxID=2731756 RepID=UPI0005F8656F|nr:S-methyl-5'-thioinosine phosphorylase [Teredinibacter purpureus]
MTIAVIGGSGFYSFPHLENAQRQRIRSRYSLEPVSVLGGTLGGGRSKVYFIARHGDSHAVPPHKVNYRANIDVLSQLGVEHIVAINAVGSVTFEMPPASIVLPDQIIDYSWGREHTYFDEFSGALSHIDFTRPLESPLREKCFSRLVDTLPAWNGGVYGCTQGPRLETSAEIRKLKADGCDLVGMTLMPEAALAREKAISYMSICVVTNWGAGLQYGKDVGDGTDVAPLNIEGIKDVLAAQLTKVQDVLVDTLILP